MSVTDEKRVERIGAWTSGHRPSLGSGTAFDRRDATTWFVGLDSWIIQDGNYRDFSVGQQREFAVEFSLLGDLQTSDTATRSTRYVEDDAYAVDAEVLAVSDDRQWWVLGLDGLAVYCNHAVARWVERGIAMSGIIALGVDPFFYFDRGSAARELPPLIYTWSIAQIFIQTAPFVERQQPKHYSRDLDAWGWRSVPSSDAWNHGMSPFYLLECQLLPTPPKRFRSAG